jgi:hypothetical protein
MSDASGARLIQSRYVSRNLYFFRRNNHAIVEPGFIFFSQALRESSVSKVTNALARLKRKWLTSRMGNRRGGVW